MKKRKKVSAYKKSLIIYTLLLLIGAEFVLIYVNDSLKDFEKGNLDNYLNSLCTDIQNEGTKGNISKYFELSDVKNNYETKSNLKKGYKELLSDAKMSYKKNDSEGYDIYADGILIATVVLDDSKTLHRLGLLTYTDYQIESLTSYNEDGLYKVDVYLPSGYKLMINNKEADEKDLYESAYIEGFEDAYEYVDLPKLNHYKIDGFSTKPDLKALDKNNKEVTLTLNENNEYQVEQYKKVSTLEEANKLLANEADPITFAENYSLFLTSNNITSGRTVYLNELSANLLPKGEVYKKMYAWATQVDCTFTSEHSNDKETFTNEKVSNFTIYADNAFSCEVYLEKNMTLTGGSKRKDVLHDIYYFVYYDGAYRVTHMQAATGE